MLLLQNGPQRVEYSHNYYASITPMELGRPERQTQAQGMLQNLLKRIGEKCILLGEGSGATMAWLATDVEPDLVACVVAVEPSGPPFGNSKMDKGIFSHRIRYSGTTRRYGLADIPLVYDPPFDAPVDFFDDFGLGTMGGPANEKNDLVAETKKSLFKLKQVTCPDDPRKTAWLQTVADIPDALDEHGNKYPPEKQPGRIRELVHVKKVPHAVITAHASAHIVYDWATIAFLRQAGCDVSWLKLQEHNITGNGHLMFLETNSNDIADLIHNWITDKLSPAPLGLPSPAAPLPPAAPIAAPAAPLTQAAAKTPAPRPKTPSVTESEIAADEMSLLVPPPTTVEPMKGSDADKDDLPSGTTPMEMSPSSSVAPPASTPAPTLTTGSGPGETPSMTSISAVPPAPVAMPGWPLPDMQMKDFLDSSYGPSAQTKKQKHNKTPSQSNIFETNMSPYYTPANPGHLPTPSNNPGTNIVSTAFDPRNAVMSTAFLGSQFGLQTPNLPLPDSYTPLPYGGNYSQATLPTLPAFYDPSAAFSGFSPVLSSTSANPNILSSQVEMPTFGQIYMATYPTEQDLSASLPPAAPMPDNLTLQNFTLPFTSIGATMPTSTIAGFPVANETSTNVETNDGKNTNEKQKPENESDVTENRSYPTNFGAPLKMNKPMAGQGDEDAHGLPKNVSGMAQTRTSYPGGFNAAVLGSAVQQAQQPLPEQAARQTQSVERDIEQGQAGFPFFFGSSPSSSPKAPSPFPLMSMNRNIGPPMTSGPVGNPAPVRSGPAPAPRSRQPSTRGRGGRTASTSRQGSTTRKPSASSRERGGAGGANNGRGDRQVQNIAMKVANEFFTAQNLEQSPTQQPPAERQTVTGTTEESSQQQVRQTAYQLPTHLARPQSHQGQSYPMLETQAFFQPMNPMPQYRSLQQPAYVQSQVHPPITPHHERSGSGASAGGPHMQQQLFTHATTPPSPSPGPRQARASDAAAGQGDEMDQGQGQGSP